MIVSSFSQFGEDEEFEPVNVGLPPMSAKRVRSAQVGEVTDLSAMAKVWLLIGRGGSGKTVMARWLGGMGAERNLIDAMLVAALDPTNRTLTHFFVNVNQPETQSADDAEAFLRKMVKFATAKRMSGVWDFGGGDVSLAKLIERNRTFDQSMAEGGVAAVAAYTLTPAVDDIAILSSFEERGIPAQRNVSTTLSQLFS
jgi:hypothetical protein